MLTALSTPVLTGSMCFPRMGPQGPATNRQPGQSPRGSADGDGAAGSALQLAGKGEGLVSRDQPHLLAGFAAPAKELDSTGSAAALAGARLIAVNNKQADFTNGALGNGHGWGGAENTDQTPRRRPLARGEHREPCVSPGLWEPKGHAAEGFTPPRQPYSSGDGASAVLILHLAR
jgi:hypothetical protein